MNDDIAELFQRAELDMRPGFEQELRELLVDVPTHLDPSSVDVWDEPLVFVTEPEAARHGLDWRRAMLSAAVILALFTGLALVARSRIAGEQGRSTTAALSGCALDAEQLGVVRTADVDIRVGLMPDGHSFCLVDNADGSSLGSNTADDLLVDASAGDTSSNDPLVVAVGGVLTAASWYVVAIPESMPVASVTAGDQLASFPTRVGRRLLVIDPVTDLPTTRGDLRELNLMSETGVVLATIEVDINALSEAGPP